MPPVDSLGSAPVRLDPQQHVLTVSCSTCGPLDPKEPEFFRHLECWAHDKWPKSFSVKESQNESPPDAGQPQPQPQPDLLQPPPPVSSHNGSVNPYSIEAMDQPHTVNEMQPVAPQQVQPLSSQDEGLVQPQQQSQQEQQQQHHIQQLPQYLQPQAASVPFDIPLKGLQPVQHEVQSQHETMANLPLQGPLPAGQNEPLASNAEEKSNAFHCDLCGEEVEKSKKAVRAHLANAHPNLDLLYFLTKAMLAHRVAAKPLVAKAPADLLSVELREEETEEEIEEKYDDYADDDWIVPNSTDEDDDEEWWCEDDEKEVKAALERAVKGEGDTTVKLERVSDEEEVEEYDDNVDDDLRGSKRFKSCPFCSQECGWYAEYYQHIKSHSQDQISYPCHVCSKTFPTVKGLRVHISTHKDQRRAKKRKAQDELSSFVCQQCGASFKGRKALRIHETKSHGGRVASPGAVSGKEEDPDFEAEMDAKDDPDGSSRYRMCPWCKESFCRYFQYYPHIMTHSPDGQSYPCHLCAKTFLSSAKLHHHVSNHSGNKPYVCHQCGAAFKRKELLSEHKRYHEDPNTFMCSQCGKAFTNKKTLSYHEKIVHSKERPHICNVCGKTFKTAHCVALHMRSHGPKNKSFCCDVCGMGFRSQIRLDAHMARPHEDRPYQCKICLKSFKGEKYLKTHMKYHTGEGLYSCEKCGKVTAYRFHLKLHVCDPSRMAQAPQPELVGKEMVDKVLSNNSGIPT